MANEEHAHEAKEEMKKHGDALQPALEGGDGSGSNPQDTGGALEPAIELPNDVTPRDQKA